MEFYPNLYDSMALPGLRRSLPSLDKVKLNRNSIPRPQKACVKLRVKNNRVTWKIIQISHYGGILTFRISLK